MPEDFSFSIVRSAHNSSYDSKSGKLVKTVRATNPEEYVTALQLTEKEMISIRNMIKEIDLASYPEEYRPYDIILDPSGDLRLSVSYGNTEIEIVCPDTELFPLEYAVSE